MTEDDLIEEYEQKSWRNQGDFEQKWSVAFS